MILLEIYGNGRLRGIAIPTVLVPLGEAVSTTTTMLPAGTSTTRTTAAATAVLPAFHFLCRAVCGYKSEEVEKNEIE